MTTISKQKKRLSRNDWLALALDVLSSEGEAELRIDKLSGKLGVTKGSFYAHFEDRADFVRQFVAYWAKTSTETVINALKPLNDSTAEARLLALMQLLHSKQMARYDIAVRAWATHDSTVAQGLQEVDRQRFEYVQRIFHDLGFRKDDLNLRTRLFVVYYSSEQGMRLPPSGLDADEEIRWRLEFLTRD